MRFNDRKVREIIQRLVRRQKRVRDQLRSKQRHRVRMGRYVISARRRNVKGRGDEG